MKKSFDMIDIAKFVGSILIFTMHCGPLSDYKNSGIILEVMARWGVPFFFISSSFFLFNKNANEITEKTSIYHYIKRISLLYLIWLICNLPNVVYKRLYFSDLSSIRTWLVFIKNSLLSSTFTGSWFLMSCIFSSLLVYWLSKKLKTKTILLNTFVIYLLCIFTSAYYGLLPTAVVSSLEFLCFPLNIFNGCFYFSMGKYICENKDNLISFFSKKKCLIFLFAFYILFVVELLFTKRIGVFLSTDVTFSIIGISFFFFLFCLQSSVCIKNGIMLRKMSTIVYCGQANVLLFNGLCKKAFGLSSIISYLLSLFLLFILCTIVLILQKLTHWKWLKYLM